MKQFFVAMLNIAYRYGWKPPIHEDEFYNFFNSSLVRIDSMKGIYYYPSCCDDFERSCHISVLLFEFMNGGTSLLDVLIKATCDIGGTPPNKEEYLLKWFSKPISLQLPLMQQYFKEIYEYFPKMDNGDTWGDKDFGW